MSWQAYVDQSLVGTGHLDKAAIFNSDGTSVWASSAGFTVAPAEVKEVITSYTDSGEPKQVETSGFHVGGVKYMTLRTSERSLYGKKGKAGIICVKTQQAILIAHYPDNAQPGTATQVVEALADYLLSLGY